MKTTTNSILTMRQWRSPMKPRSCSTRRNPNRQWAFMDKFHQPQSTMRLSPLPQNPCLSVKIVHISVVHNCQRPVLDRKRALTTTELRTIFALHPKDFKIGRLRKYRYPRMLTTPRRWVLSRHYPSQDVAPAAVPRHLQRRLCISIAQHRRTTSFMETCELICSFIIIRRQFRQFSWRVDRQFVYPKCTDKVHSQNQVQFAIRPITAAMRIRLHLYVSWRIRVIAMLWVKLQPMHWEWVSLRIDKKCIIN